MKYGCNHWILKGYNMQQDENNVIPLYLNGDPRINTFIDDVENLIYQRAEIYKMPFVTTIGCLEFIKNKLIRDLYRKIEE